MPCRLLVRLDANNNVGYGHIVRTGGLIEQIKTPLSPVIVGALDDPPIAIAETLPYSNSTGGSALEEAIAAVKPDAILVDLPTWVDRPWAAFRRAGVPVIAIDDEGGPVEADLIVNGTALDEYHRYDEPGPPARKLIGPAYALLRAPFGARSWRQPATPRLLIVIGSGERAYNWAHRLADGGLDGLPVAAVDIVVGAAFADPENLKCRDPVVTIHQNVPAAALAELMANASVGLMTGGMVVYEALAVGLPVVAFPLIANMVPEIAWFAARGSISDLGYDGGMNVSLVRKRVMALLGDKAAAEAQSAAGRAIIDGQGSWRVARAIDALLAP
jgi:spore coat polysaccharide biosynthesis predicted glycosyltransferase SpsG